MNRNVLPVLGPNFEMRRLLVDAQGRVVTEAVASPPALPAQTPVLRVTADGRLRLV
jgi:hypothetical protein